MLDRVIVVPDTNFLLHCTFLAEIPWDESFPMAVGSIVIPPRVITEVDQKKYDPVGRVARRAKRVIKLLEGAIEGPIALEGGQEVELFRPPIDFVRSNWADDDIVRTCLLIASSDSRPVYLLTNDLGMRISASAEFGERASVLRVPDVLQPPGEAGDREERTRKPVKLQLALAGGSFLTPPAPKVLTVHGTPEEVLARRAREVPRLRRPTPNPYTVFNTSEEDVQQFNRDRDTWLDDIRDWLAAQHRVALLRALSFELPLTVANLGRDTGQDVEIRVHLIEGTQGRGFFSAERLDVEELPDEPDAPHEPSGLAYNLPYESPDYYVQTGWKVSDDLVSATLSMPRLRPTGRPEAITPALFVGPLADAMPVDSFAITWEAYSTTPSSSDTGTFQIRQRPPVL